MPPFLAPSRTHFGVPSSLSPSLVCGGWAAAEGVCGIRPWQHIASDYCYKARAANALKRLVAEIPARRIFLSYSTEGHVPLSVLNEAFQGLGEVVMHHLDAIGRYRPNRAASEAGSEVGEVLFSIEKPAAESREAA